MDDEELARIHAAHRRPGFGTVSASELTHFRDLIAEHRPRSFVEIGTASGLSGGIVARLLDEHGGTRFVTLDRSETFFADPAKETGYLIPEIYPGGAVEVSRHVGRTALDVPGLGETFEMAFVDADHEHPWPIIDTLCLYPVMTGPRLVLQHDLNLYQKQRIGRSVGPKFLFDQFPESHRTRHAARSGNLFSVSLDLPRERVEEMARDLFTIPWTLSHKLREDVLIGFRAVLAEHYSPALGEVFDRARAIYNLPNGSYMRPWQQKNA